MRRLDPTSLPRFLANGEPPPQEARQQPGLWTASFVLRSITPILGGGIQSFEPDNVDLVRPPAIRGQLRWWWRALFQEWGEHPDPDALFTQEARLWGGVGVPGEAESPGLHSRVRIAVEVLDRERSKVVPAGVHDLRPNGRLKAMPRWTIGKLGYALFPLQRVSEEREDFEREQPGCPMDTRRVQKEVWFRLRLSLAGTKPGFSPAPEEVRQVLAAVWAWVCFGGLGARTRRGFGALEVAEPIRLGPVPEADVEAWCRLFQGPRGPEGIRSWLQELERAASPRGRVWPPSRILVSGERPTALAAHEEIVEQLRCFRQGRDVGRDPGEGQSRWPEPHLLRALVPLRESSRPFEHAPPPRTREQARAGSVGAPRAAFGLPIEVQFFFEHKGDRQANAVLLPEGARRWPSPLLVRPLRTASGKYHPAAVFLPIPPPREVTIEYKNSEKTTRSCPVARSGGARDPIFRLLKETDGKALDAFAEWLVRERGYSRA